MAALQLSYFFLMPKGGQIQGKMLLVMAGQALPKQYREGHYSLPLSSSCFQGDSLSLWLGSFMLPYLAKVLERLQDLLNFQHRVRLWKGDHSSSHMRLVDSRA